MISVVFEQLPLKGKYGVLHVWEISKEWKEWCLKIGKLVTNKDIDTEPVIKKILQKNTIRRISKDIHILPSSWSEELYDRIHKLAFEMPSKNSFVCFQKEH